MPNPPTLGRPKGQTLEAYFEARFAELTDWDRPPKAQPSKPVSLPNYTAQRPVTAMPTSTAAPETDKRGTADGPPWKPFPDFSKATAETWYGLLGVTIVLMGVAHVWEWSWYEALRASIIPLAGWQLDGRGFPLLVCLLYLSLVTIVDLLTMRIPFWLTLPAMSVLFVFHALGGSFILPGYTVLCVFAVFQHDYGEVLGAGDRSIFMVIGAALGPFPAAAVLLLCVAAYQVLAYTGGWKLLPRYGDYYPFAPVILAAFLATVHWVLPWAGQHGLLWLSL